MENAMDGIERQLRHPTGISRQNTWDDLMELIKNDSTEKTLQSPLIDEERSIDLVPILEYLQDNVTSDTTSPFLPDDHGDGSTSAYTVSATLESGELSTDDEFMDHAISGFGGTEQNNLILELFEESYAHRNTPPSSVVVHHLPGSISCRPSPLSTKRRPQRVSSKDSSSSQSDLYREKREKNNVAVRQSRAKAKQAAAAKERMSGKLKKENDQLRNRAKQLEEEIRKWKMRNAKLEAEVKCKVTRGSTE